MGLLRPRGPFPSDGTGSKPFFKYKGSVVCAIWLCAWTAVGLGLKGHVKCLCRIPHMHSIVLSNHVGSLDIRITLPNY